MRGNSNTKTSATTNINSKKNRLSSSFQCRKNLWFEIAVNIELVADKKIEL